MLEWGIGGARTPATPMEMVDWFGLETLLLPPPRLQTAVKEAEWRHLDGEVLENMRQVVYVVRGV